MTEEVTYFIDIGLNWRDRCSTFPFPIISRYYTFKTTPIKGTFKYFIKYFGYMAIAESAIIVYPNGYMQWAKNQQDYNADLPNESEFLIQVLQSVSV